MTISERVVARLRKQHGLDLPADTYVRRLYAGWAMKAAGAWSWTLWSPDGDNTKTSYGSQWPATRLLRCRDWQIEVPNRNSPDLSIDPCDDCYGKWTP